MSTQAILRFWTLVACLGAFLDEQRALQDDELSTWGDARRALQKEHQRNLLAWLEDQIKTGFTTQQIGAQLGLFSS